MIDFDKIPSYQVLNLPIGRVTSRFILPGSPRSARLTSEKFLEFDHWKNCSESGTHQDPTKNSELEIVHAQGLVAKSGCRSYEPGIQAQGLGLDHGTVIKVSLTDLAYALHCAPLENQAQRMDRQYPVLENGNNFANAEADTANVQGDDGELPPGHKRSLSGSILSKLSFLRAGADGNHTSANKTPMGPEFLPGDDNFSPKKTSRAMAVAVQQQKTRRRKGSLRKAALLGRGAQREKKELKTISLDIGHHSGYSALSPTSPKDMHSSSAFALGISDATPRPSMEGYASRSKNVLLSPIKTLPMGTDDHLITSPTAATSPTLTYASTTDEDDVLSIPNHSLPGPRVGLPNSSGSDSYFPAGVGSLTRRRSAQKAKSPLSLGGLAASPLPAPDAEWDYSETEWWGWFVLIVTWIVFVTGMGSCLGVWSWAWDVGETPYAPPELEDDPTLPIVGYYPALIILTAVMAWVWVVVAWVGMKYFRHAKISGD